MKKCNMITGNINSIESFGLVDGPGIRTVIFLNGCNLRCKYCHNPEMWHKTDNIITPEQLVKKVKRFKPYYKDTGGVTFSGGEPLLQQEFIIETSKLLKKENINIAIDTSGVGLGNYKNLLDLIDLVILDIKHTDKLEYKKLTGQDIEKVENFITELNRSNKKVWIRQVIIPGLTDTFEYITSLVKYISKINNIERVDFLPYHQLGKEKYIKLNIDYPYKNKKDMDKEKCNILFKFFLERQKSSNNN